MSHQFNRVIIRDEKWLKWHKILCATDLKSMSKIRISYNFLDIEKNKSFYRNLKKYALEE